MDLGIPPSPRERAVPRHATMRLGTSTAHALILLCCFPPDLPHTKSSGHRTGKGQFSFQSQRKAMTKECSNYHTIAFISHASKVMLKNLQARLQQYVSRELPDVQAGFRKGRGTRDQIANICWIIKKIRQFQKSIYF